ncbi:MAG: HesB/IscA family protein [Pleurocapsa sp.]
MLQISSSAVKEIQRIQRNKTQPDISLKLTVNSGGCSGLFYELKLEHQDSSQDGDRANVPQSDRLIEIDGVKVVVDGDSWQYVENLEIDYAEDIMGGGFRFHNPLAKNVCGCGISFAIA